MIDSHIHLTQYPREQVDRLVEEWRQKGIHRIVAVSTDLRSSYQTLQLKTQYPDFIYAAVGYHPEQPLPPEPELKELISLIKQERDLLAAIGEVGVPHYSLPSLGEAVVGPYFEMIELFADIAVDLSLPVILHAVHDKANGVLQRLTLHKVHKAHFHWLKAPQDVIAKIVQAGYYVSVTPEVCYRERDRQLVLQVPIPQLLMETDGPWGYEGQFHGQQTTPLFLFEAAREIASLTNLTFETFLEQHDQNVQDLYGDSARCR